MDDTQITLIPDDEKNTASENAENFTAKERKLIQQLVQERLGRKRSLDYEPLDDYIVPAEVMLPMIKKPAVSLRYDKLEFSMSSVRLFEGVQYILPMRSANRKKLTIAICAEEELSSIMWARKKTEKGKEKWVNRPITCPEFTKTLYDMMGWNPECRYKAFGHISNSERGLLLVYDLAQAVMFDPMPEEYIDKKTGQLKKRTVKYYPDEIRMKLGRSYSEYAAIQERSQFESLSGYTDTDGNSVASNVTEEMAASISAQGQQQKRAELLGNLMNGGEGNGIDP